MICFLQLNRSGNGYIRRLRTSVETPAVNQLAALMLSVSPLIAGVKCNSRRPILARPRLGHKTLPREHDPQAVAAPVPVTICQGFLPLQTRHG